MKQSILMRRCPNARQKFHTKRQVLFSLNTTTTTNATTTTTTTTTTSTTTNNNDRMSPATNFV